MRHSMRVNADDILQRRRYEMQKYEPHQSRSFMMDIAP
jgi:hypothetical protein